MKEKQVNEGVENNQRDKVNKKYASKKIVSVERAKDNLTKEELENSINLIFERALRDFISNKLQIEDKHGHSVTLSFKENEQMVKNMQRLHELLPIGILDSFSSFIRGLVRLGMSQLEWIIDKQSIANVELWDKLLEVHRMLMDIIQIRDYEQIKDLYDKLIDEYKETNKERADSLKKIKTKHLKLIKPESVWKDDTTMSIKVSNWKKAK